MDQRLWSHNLRKLNTAQLIMILIQSGIESLILLMYYMNIYNCVHLFKYLDLRQRAKHSYESRRRFEAAMAKCIYTSEI